jgi:hypothetical protein
MEALKWCFDVISVVIRSASDLYTWQPLLGEVRARFVVIWIACAQVLAWWRGPPSQWASSRGSWRTEAFLCSRGRLPRYVLLTVLPPRDTLRTEVLFICLNFSFFFCLCRRLQFFPFLLVFFCAFYAFFLYLSFFHSSVSCLLGILSNSMVQSPSWKLIVTQLVKKSPLPQPFTKPEGSLPCSQQPATGLYLEPDESSPHLPTIFP